MTTIATQRGWDTQVLVESLLDVDEADNAQRFVTRFAGTGVLVPESISREFEAALRDARIKFTKEEVILSFDRYRAWTPDPEQ